MNRHKKNRLVNAVKMWCLCRGFSVTELRSGTADLVCENKGKTVGFVILTEQTDGPLPFETGCDLTYAVITDPENRSAVRKNIPTAWGILCYGNQYGLGCLYQLFREAK